MSISKPFRVWGMSLCLLISLRLMAQDHQGPSRLNLFLDEETKDRLAMEPRITFSMFTHYFSVSGFAYTSNGPGTISEDIVPLDINSNLGVSNILVYDLALDFRLSLRNHLFINYLLGQSSGSGTIDSPVPFNDHYFRGPGETDGGLELNSFQIEWYLRSLALEGALGRYDLDLGAGVMNFKSYVSFATEAQEDRLDTEEIFAPFSPYLLLRSVWQPWSRLTLGTNFKVALLNLDFQGADSLGFGEYFQEPSKFRGYFLNSYLQYHLSQSVNLVGGIDYWKFELDFDGVEPDGHLARNEVDLEMYGAYLGLALNDPHKIIISAFQNLLR